MSFRIRNRVHGSVNAGPSLPLWRQYRWKSSGFCCHCPQVKLSGYGNTEAAQGFQLRWGVNLHRVYGGLFQSRIQDARRRGIDICVCVGPYSPLQKRIKLHFPASITFYNGLCLSSTGLFISSVSPSLSHVENLISIQAFNGCSSC